MLNRISRFFQKPVSIASLSGQNQSFRRKWILPMVAAAAVSFVIFTVLFPTIFSSIAPPIEIPVSNPTLTNTSAPEVPTASMVLPWLTTPPLAYQRPNRSGPEVMALQEQLRELEYLRGDVDGYFGLATLTALKRFQINQMLSPTGEVDEATAHRLADPKKDFSPPLHPPADPLEVIVDISTRSLTIRFANGDQYVFPCTVGKPRTPTPTGTYTITNKGRWNEQFGGFWLGLNVRFGWYGIHGTQHPWTIGMAESEGCIRLLNEYARIVYNWLPIGTKVTINGLPSGRMLMDGTRGTDVALVQRKLIEKGFLSGGADGVYGPATTSAVAKFQRHHNLYASGRVTEKVYELLDIETDPEQGRPTPAQMVLTESNPTN